MANRNKVEHRVLCVIMDGMGVRESRFGNAVALAKTPNLKKLADISLYTTLKAHGTYVGLPSNDDIGNSEVGHNAIGAGRIFAQGAKLINQAFETGRIYEGKTWREIVAWVKAHHGTLHFLGLLSDGNVHSHEQHLYQMLRHAKQEGIRRVRVHVLFDGRDVGEKSAEVYVNRLEHVMAELRSPDFDIRAASGGGRMRITMDRYNADWGMVKRGWDTHVRGLGPQFSSLNEALATFRQDPKLSDQYLPEFVIAEHGKPIGRIEDGDGVILFNFRGDRAIEISRAFTEENLSEFDRGSRPNVYYAGMMEYDGDLHIPPHYLVSPPEIDRTLTEYLLKCKVRQFACSETQKFGHVTYFWNGNRSGYIDQSLEEYVEIPSDSGISFDARPQMKAPEITDVTVEAMQQDRFDFGRINYANGDMVGHTGNLKAAIAAVETVDTQLGRLMDVAAKTNTILVITADHGNCDEMFDAKESDFANWSLESEKQPTKPKTSHTLAPVPLFIYGPGAEQFDLASVEPRTLGNLANTFITLLGLPTSQDFLPPLIKRKNEK